MVLLLFSLLVISDLVVGLFLRPHLHGRCMWVIIDLQKNMMSSSTACPASQSQNSKQVHVLPFVIYSHHVLLNFIEWPARHATGYIITLTFACHAPRL